MVKKTIKTKTGARWEIYLYHVGKVPQYGTRLIARNGKVIDSNTGFNTLHIAYKNILSVIRNSPI